MKLFHSIRWRLALTTAGFVLATQFLLGAYFYYRLMRNLDRQVERFLDDEYREMETLLSEGDDELKEEMHTLERAHVKVPLYVQARGASGEVLVRTANLLGQDLPFPPESRASLDAGGRLADIQVVRDHNIRMRTRRHDFPDGRIRYLQVGISETQARETERAFLAQAGTAALPFALLALIGGLLVANRAIRPVDAISATASHIRAQNLSERIPLRGSGDELDQLATVLNSTFSELEDSFRKIRDFSASASHQLKTPLTVIRGEAELLLRDATREADMSRLSTIIDEAARLARITDQLLFLARADAEKVEITFEEVDLHAIVERGLRRVEPYVTVKGLTLDVKLDGAPKVHGSDSLLGTAIQNLLDNAAKFTPERGTIRVRWESSDGVVAVEVEDDGEGIAPEARALVMERFSQRATPQKGGGAGLGLAVAREIAQLHHGSLTARDPRAGRGACFRLEIPKGTA